MRIAIVGNYPVDSSRIEGGVQAAFTYLVRGLRRIDSLQIHVITQSNCHPDGAEIEQDGVTLHLLPALPRFEFLRGYCNYRSQLDAVLARIRPDAVHAQSSGDHGYVVTRSGYPAVITVHGVLREDTKYAPGDFLKILKSRLKLTLIERYNLRHIRHLIAISPYVINYFSSLLSPEVRVYHIPNAIDEKYFDLRDLSDGYTILFAGRVIPRKRPLDLLKAFAQISPQLPRAQLRIAGEYRSASEYVGTIQAFVQRVGLGDQIHFLGSLSEEAILKEFAACDILVLPSDQETAPMVIAQAMAAGKPVVATPVGGVADMVQDGRTGFLTPVGDVARLAEALQALLQDSDLRTRMGSKAKSLALKKYHVTVVARRTYEAYQDIAGR